MTRNPPWLASLLEEHFEEIQMLWELRSAAMRDAAYREAGIVELDNRIEAHIDALAIAGDKAWPLLEAGLSGEPAAAFAAAIVLLRQGAAATEKVLAALEQAEGPALDGLCEALGHSHIDPFADRLRKWYEDGPTRIAVIAAHVFAYHKRFQASSKRLPEFLQDPDPLVRRTAWRIVALVDE